METATAGVRRADDPASIGRVYAALVRAAATDRRPRRMRLVRFVEHCRAYFANS